MRQLALIISFIMTSVLTVKVRAHVEVNAFYTGEALSAGSTMTSNRTFIEAAIGFSIDKKAQYNVGWNYSMMSMSDVSTTTTTYSSTYPSLHAVWVF